MSAFDRYLKLTDVVKMIILSFSLPFLLARIAPPYGSLPIHLRNGPHFCILVVVVPVPFESYTIQT